ncbi:hypothetical protein TSA1_08260 [Bradyrhizobium nitroreducens]|uniref:Uncharacterized protein n=1 Tax=Bradyrhizobium nitroreducens TaxID=709803 RepID=A0A2M6U854_9BRAD|nr:hypothetical protein TSA1_08260 [Bradyrhizobium nitroreducens]
MAGFMKHQILTSIKPAAAHFKFIFTKTYQAELISSAMELDRQADGAFFWRGCDRRSLLDCTPAVL